MSTITTSPAVAQYAAAVRGHLAGLDAELLDDLTDGLEADLADSLADGNDGPARLTALTLPDVIAQFGLPAAYADELCDAAGVVPVAPPAPPRRTLRAALGDWLAGLTTRYPQIAKIGAFFVTLRPVWWVMRAWVAYQVVTFVANSQADHPFVPRSFLTWLVLFAFIVGSVQAGRNSPPKRGGLRHLLRILNVFAVVAFLPVLLTVNQSPPAGYHSETLIQPMPGVTVNGQSATNLFVYGPDGAPIDGAQIVDQDGNPVVLGMPDRPDMAWDQWDGIPLWFDVPLAATNLNNPQGLNVYPYRFVPFEALTNNRSDETGAVDPTLALEPRWPAPNLFPIAPPALGQTEPTAEPTETSAPTGSEPTAPETTEAP